MGSGFRSEKKGNLVPTNLKNHATLPAPMSLTDNSSWPACQSTSVLFIWIWCREFSYIVL